ncbi:MAG TPA: class I SAM-dependent methyltransferase [Rugosimonospora sp.]|jgi:SAM-dependent methyltransferase
MDAQEWDRRYADGGLLWAAEPNRFVAETFAGVPAGRALDLAAGEGRNAIWLAGQGWQVTAVDFSAVAIGKGRAWAERQGYEVDWRVADVLSYDPPRGGFDAVIVAYLHLMPDDFAAALDTAASAVTAGGLLLVVGHDVSNIQHGTGGPQDPAVLYTPETVRARLDGWEIRRAERARRPVATDAGEVEAIDTVVVALRPASG